jgi:DNA-binding CsgD family transcriptional regulator
MSLLDVRTAYARFHDRGGIESKRYWPWHLPTPLVDKLLLCQRTDTGTYVLEFSRWGEICEYDTQTVERATEIGRLLMNLSAMHRRLLILQLDPIGAFRSSDDIERCLAHTTALTRRERQVCALHLLGASGATIGAELGIEAESVKSYRKRAYLRLGVSSERELLLKFLSLRTAWQGRSVDLEAPLDPWRMPFLVAGQD